MFHVGLDIHSTRITICVLGETGQVVHRAQVRTIEEMLATLKDLPDRFEVCYEASCGYGHYHDVLRPLAVRVLVVATAHYLVRVMWAMLRHGTTWQENPARAA